jgi:hypothetical protein
VRFSGEGALARSITGIAETDCGSTENIEHAGNFYSLFITHVSFTGRIVILMLISMNIGTTLWYCVAIADATGSTYTTPVLALSDSGESFSGVVSNPVNTVTSAAAILTVNAAIAPTITQQPASLSVLANNPATFSVGASGSSPFTYAWQFNGVTLLGANSPTYTILAVQPTNVGQYTVIVTNAAGSVTSAATTLTIAPPGLNLALNRPATASSSQSGGLTPNFVNDGNLTTRWSSASGIDPSWVEITMQVGH